MTRCNCASNHAQVKLTETLFCACSRFTDDKLASSTPNGTSKTPSLAVTPHIPLMASARQASGRASGSAHADRLTMPKLVLPSSARHAPAQVGHQVRLYKKL